MYMTNRITRLGTIPSSRQTAGGRGITPTTTTPEMFGGDGAVRIVWGQGRAFPSTDVGLTEE